MSALLSNARRLVLGLLLASALALPACKSQDAAIFVTIKGGFIIPTNANKLIVDVLENGAVLVRKTYTLTADTPLPVSVTLIEGGKSHPHVKINALLYKGDILVGRGNIEADFVGGATAQVSIDVLPQ